MPPSPRLALIAVSLSVLFGCGSSAEDRSPDASPPLEASAEALLDASVDATATDAGEADGMVDLAALPDTATNPADAPPMQRCTQDRVVDAYRYYGESAATGRYSGRIEYRRSPGLLLEILYSRPGPDGRWATADDEIEMYWRTEINGPTGVGKPITHPGNDGVWFTADDIADGRIACSTYDPDGRILTLLETYGANGDDGLPCTFDEDAYRGTRHEYGPGGREERTITLKFPGPDRRWFTADDKLDLWQLFVYGDDGSVRESRFARSPGPDGRWLTDDDPLQTAFVRTYVGSEGYDDHAVMGPDGPSTPSGVYYSCVPPPP